MKMYNCATCIHRDTCERAQPDTGFFCGKYQDQPVPARNPANDPNARWLRGEDVDGI